MYCAADPGLLFCMPVSGTARCFELRHLQEADVMLCRRIPRHRAVPDTGIQNSNPGSAAQYMTCRHHFTAVDHHSSAEGITAGTGDFNLDDPGRHRNPVGLIERHALCSRTPQAGGNKERAQFHHAVTTLKVSVRPCHPPSGCRIPAEEGKYPRDSDRALAG